MNKLMQVRKEYDEPFVDVVRGFGEQGFSRSLTARTLGINLSYFRQLLTRFDLHGAFRDQGQMIKSCRGGQYIGGRWPKGVPRLSLRKPIEYKGLTYYPGEPMHHYLFSRKKI